MTTETRTCQNCKTSFAIEPDDFAFYEKMHVPPPTFCPECRMVRRAVWWCHRTLFRRTESVKGKEVFSLFHQDVKLPVYDRDYWWSDAWDAMEYGRDYDFSRPFFAQMRELIYVVPWPARSTVNVQNSPYVSSCSDVKNSYLSFAGTNLENSAYVTFFNTVKEGFDLHESRHSELCYDSYMVDEAYRVFFSVNVEDCTDVWFSRNLIGCQNCFSCVNLRNKSYHIFNQPYTREAYREFIERFRSGSYAAVAEARAKAHAFWLVHPMRFTLAINVTNSTGEHIEHSRNVHASYGVHDAEDVKYSQMVEDIKDSYDVTRRGTASSLIYEGSVVGLEANRIKFSTHVFLGVNDLEYCVYCPGSSNLFGCVGLRKKQYCIFNKQYSKEEYFKLRERIIEHMSTMPYISPRTRHPEQREGSRDSSATPQNDGIEYRYGEFFPPEFSPFAYNETIAQDFFPLTKEQAEAKGFLWREPERREYEITVNATDLPDDIKDVPDTLVREIIKCLECGRAYRIIEMEFAFLKRIKLPLPRKCHECRFKDRFQFVNPPKFWHGICQCAGTSSDKRPISADLRFADGFGKARASAGRYETSDMAYTNVVPHFHGSAHCPNEFETSYAPGRQEIIYCEKCYQQEVA